MKISWTSGFLLSLLIVVILGVALLFTGIWYLVLLSGLVASLVIKKGYLASVLSSFVGGLIVILIVFLTLPISHIAAIMSEVGSIAGISSMLLLAMIFLVNAGLCVSGALIGTFVSGSILRGGGTTTKEKAGH